MVCLQEERWPQHQALLECSYGLLNDLVRDYTNIHLGRSEEAGTHILGATDGTNGGAISCRRADMSTIRLCEVAACASLTALSLAALS